jgi:DNA invertase Pin-like site-specific DNA recombinase
MEDHVAIRALLRRRSVTLVSVTENLEETASGRLVEGIHALMAEFYSANLASEIKKGMAQKAKMGGWPHPAPEREEASHSNPRVPGRGFE